MRDIILATDLAQHLRKVKDLERLAEGMLLGRIGQLNYSFIFLDITVSSGSLSLSHWSGFDFKAGDLIVLNSWTR